MPTDDPIAKSLALRTQYGGPVTHVCHYKPTNALAVFQLRLKAPAVVQDINMFESWRRESESSTRGDGRVDHAARSKLQDMLRGDDAETARPKLKDIVQDWLGIGQDPPESSSYVQLNSTA